MYKPHMRWHKVNTFMSAKAADNFCKICLLLASLLWSGGWVQAADEVPDPLKPQYTEKGAERCLLCHSELRMELMTETPHGNRENPDTPFAKHDCESCHGPGSFHVSRSRRGKGRPPMITFGDGAKTPADEQIETCLACHGKDLDRLRQMDGHKNASKAYNAETIDGLTCSTCHTVHLLPPGHEQKGADLSAALTARRLEPADYTEVGPQKCLLCHVKPRIGLITKTAHGNKSNPETPFGQHACESCHGKGSLHVSRAMQGKNRPPMISFGHRAKTPIKEQIDTCLSCHEKDRDRLRKMEGHRNAIKAYKAKTIDDLSCSTCHTMHPFPGGAGPSASASYTERGPQKCLLCHSSKRMHQMVDGPHGDASDPHTPFAKQGCETCHGKGSQHVSQSRLGKGRPPMINFGEDTHTPVPAQTTVCLSCHKQQMNALPAMEWRDSVHDQQSVACASCHTLHTDSDPLRINEVQADTCFSCHTEAKTQHPRFEDKSIKFDSLSCWTCHDVHQLIPQQHGSNDEDTSLKDEPALSRSDEK